MRLALRAILLPTLLTTLVVTCLPQDSQLVPAKHHYVVTEAKTISLQELQQRNQSKASAPFVDAKVAARKGDHLHAIKLFEKVLRIDPLFADARNDLAVELIVAGQPDRAVDELQQLLQLVPHFLMGYTNLAVVFCNQKKFADAEAVLRRAISIDPNSPKANLLLAIALYGQGKRDAETHSALEIAARSNPTAIKLLKEWFGVEEVAASLAPN